MTKRTIPALLIGLALWGCSSPASPSGDSQSITPIQAIVLAADAAPFGVKGTFALEVRGAGRRDGNIYLNSEADYRDQRCLTVAIFPEAFQGLKGKFGGEPDVALRGKRIKVSGVAMRVKIGFLADGRMTDRYYYQTHVNVTDSAQVDILP